MKKLAITIAIVLGLGMTSFANPNNSGLFQRGQVEQNNGGFIDGLNRSGGTPGLPGHGSETNEPAPLGTGIAMLTAFGAAYLVSKRKREE